VTPPWPRSPSPALAVDDGGDGPDAGRRQSGVPLRPAGVPDGLPGSEGTFSLCTFLYIDALARTGRLDEARMTFSKMLTYANHLGLYSEEIDPTGQQVGNFPQAFTHLALIQAVLRLDDQLNRRRP
jgi:GH15 family glucan-1,4-alpha-glucosidase